MGEVERTRQNDEPDGERTKTEERPQQGPGGRAASRPPLWGTAPTQRYIRPGDAPSRLCPTSTPSAPHSWGHPHVGWRASSEGRESFAHTTHPQGRKHPHWGYSFARQWTPPATPRSTPAGGGCALAPRNTPHPRHLHKNAPRTLTAPHPRSTPRIPRIHRTHMGAPEHSWGHKDTKNPSGITSTQKHPEPLKHTPPQTPPQETYVPPKTVPHLTGTPTGEQPLPPSPAQRTRTPTHGGPSTGPPPPHTDHTPLKPRTTVSHAPRSPHTTRSTSTPRTHRPQSTQRIHRPPHLEAPPTPRSTTPRPRPPQHQTHHTNPATAQEGWTPNVMPTRTPTRRHAPRSNTRPELTRTHLNPCTYRTRKTHTQNPDSAHTTTPKEPPKTQPPTHTPHPRDSTTSPRSTPHERTPQSDPHRYHQVSHAHRTLDHTQGNSPAKPTWFPYSPQPHERPTPHVPTPQGRKHLTRQPPHLGVTPRVSAPLHVCPAYP